MIENILQTNVPLLGVLLVFVGFIFRPRPSHYLVSIIVFVANFMVVVVCGLILI